MTISKFIEAPEIARINAIWRGKLIAERLHEDVTYRLFKVDDFYVEARINPLSFTRHFTAYATLDEIMPLYSDAPASDLYAASISF